MGYEEFLPVFDGFTEGVLIVDRRATIIYYNPSMAATAGSTPIERGQTAG
jgi:PAS domain-containing protein